MSLKAGTLAVYWYLNPLTAGAEYIVFFTQLLLHLIITTLLSMVEP